jgi:hypothetical protein
VGGGVKKRPIDQAKELFGSYFEELCDFYFENGYIYSGPDAFAIAVPHNKDSLLRPCANNKIDKCDCWLIQYVAGDMGRLLQLLDDLAFKPEWIVFERDDEDIRYSEEHKYKAYNLKRLTEKLHGKRRVSTETTTTTTTTTNRDIA